MPRPAQRFTYLRDPNTGAQGWVLLPPDEYGYPRYACRAAFAASGRAKCAKCGAVIPDKSLRVATPRKYSGGFVDSWHHVDCVWFDQTVNNRARFLPPEPPASANEILFDPSLSQTDRQKVFEAARRVEAPKLLESIAQDSSGIQSVLSRHKLADPKEIAQPSSLACDLLDFQKQGLWWMLEQEKNSKGGILADQMGLGKTLQTISLIIESKRLDPDAGPTLVVAPSTAMTQWVTEIREKVVPHGLTVLTYHGTERRKLLPRDLSSVDVVVTAYPMLEIAHRKCENRAKVKCELCGKRLLPSKIDFHLKYFCGEGAQKTEKQARAGGKKQSKETIQKGLRALNVVDDDDDDEGPSFPTLSGVYADHMREAGRTPAPMGVSAEVAREISAVAVVDLTMDDSDEDSGGSEAVLRLKGGGGKKRSRAADDSEVDDDDVDDVAERRPVKRTKKSAYAFFSSEKMLALKSEGLSFGDASKRISEEWKSVKADPERLRKYAELAEAHAPADPVDKNPVDKNAPKRPKTAYAFFAADRRASLRLTMSDSKAITKRIAEEWKIEPRTEWDAKRAEDEKRYEKELESYVTPPGFAAPSYKKKKKKAIIVSKKPNATKKNKSKDPNAPKKNKTARELFLEERRSRLSEDERTQKKGVLRDALNAEWAALDDHVRIVYENLARQDLKRFHDETAAYVCPPEFRTVEAETTYDYESEGEFDSDALEDQGLSEGYPGRFVPQTWGEVCSDGSIVDLPEGITEPPWRVVWGGDDSSDSEEEESSEDDLKKPHKPHNKDEPDKKPPTRNNRKRIVYSKSPQYAPPGQVLSDSGLDMNLSLLHCVAWRRVVLDEAHKIKNKERGTAKGAFALRGKPRPRESAAQLVEKAKKRSAQRRTEFEKMPSKKLAHRVLCGETALLREKLLRIRPQSLEDECSRWCLSGTPLQNRVKELGSLIRFLRADPYAYYFCRVCLRRNNEQPKCKCLTWPERHCGICGHSCMSHGWFVNKAVFTPIAKFGQRGTGRDAFEHMNQTLLPSIMLRRSKNDVAEQIGLPKLTIETYYLTLTDSERVFYESMYKHVNVEFNHYIDAGYVRNNYAHIFELLSKLRQAVNHPWMVSDQRFKANASADTCHLCWTSVEDVSDLCVASCGDTFHRDCLGEYVDSIEEDDPKCPKCKVALTVDYEMTIRVDDDESEGGEETCVVCMESPRDTLFFPCGHTQTCKKCFANLEKCPVCREKVVRTQRFSSVSTESKKLFGRSSMLQKYDLDKFVSSRKLDAVHERLKKVLVPSSPPHKVVVFSQFTNMLDLIQFHLKNNKIDTVKLTGSLNMSEKNAVLKAFKTDDSCNVILMSLKSGGEGLNLQHADHVFLVDPWWNPAVEHQAMQRAHRIGQKRPVFVTRFCVRDSIEERMLDLQRKKQNVFDAGVEGESAAYAELDEADLKFLFG